MPEARRKIIEMKTKCNTNLKTILTTQQYADVISICKSVR